MGSNKLPQELIEAARFGQASRVMVAIESGADLNNQDLNGTTALMFASKLGSEDIVDILITAGANVNIQRGKLGVTALMLAASSGHRQVVQKLLAAGANVQAVNIDGSTALMAAALAGDSEIVADLIAAGAEVNAIDQADDTALNIAILQNNLLVVRQLIQAGADVERVGQDGRTPAMLIPAPGDVALLQELLGMALRLIRWMLMAILCC